MPFFVLDPARQALEWLACAARPLVLRELRMAIGTQEEWEESLAAASKTPTESCV